MFNGHDLVGYILFDIWRKMCDNRIDEFISIMNHVEKESLIYFIKCWIKTVGLERTKIIHILNWVLKGQWNWNHHILPWMIKGWEAHLSVILCLCGWDGQRSLCQPRKHKRGNEQKGKCQMLSQTQDKKFCSDFSKEKDDRFEMEVHSFIESTNI